MLLFAFIPLFLLVNGSLASTAYWARANAGFMPTDAWRAATDQSGNHVFIGRVNHNGAMFAATITRVNQRSFTCRYSAEGQSFPCQRNFEVFVGGTHFNVEWSFNSNGNVPTQAIHLGGAENHFVGRVSAARTWEIGTVEQQFRGLFLPAAQNGQWVERSLPSYQVLRFRF